MNVLIVHAHHEPQSFCSALFRVAARTLSEAGHKVIISDLYTDHFDPVSDRRNFVSVHDPAYLKQQYEERHATDVKGFSPALESEIQKLEACDLLIFTFPIWWFALPAILKGWVDRVFAMRRIYGDGKLYENGLGKAKKRAMIIMTVGGSADAYGGLGVNPPMQSILSPIQHGVFWFNGFLPLDPFIAWSPVRATSEQRAAYLDQLARRLRSIDSESTIELPPLSDFPGFGKDQKKRFMAVLSPKASDSCTLSAADVEYLDSLKRRSIILSSHFTAQPPWQAFLLFRGTARDQIQEHLRPLSVSPLLQIEISALSGS